jgi:hypothetical protein
MRYRRFLTLLFTACILPLAAVLAQNKSLKKSVTLVVPEETNGLVSRNGAGVAWNPEKRHYVTAQAGNAGFYLGVFSESGQRLSPDDLTTSFDLRGIWYNPVAKSIQGNGYNDFGWAAYSYDDKGMPVLGETLREGLHQPDENAVGALNPDRQQLLFLDEILNIVIYDLKTGESDGTIKIWLGTSKKKMKDKNEESRADAMANYNISTPVWTGIKGAEIGLLNTASRTVELYSSKTGLLTRQLELPSGVPAPGMFNFSYANGLFWFFDTNSRTWIGCN